MDELKEATAPGGNAGAPAVGRRVRRTLAWAGAALAVFASGVGAGYLLRPHLESPRRGYEIRPGRAGLTDPLLDCEIPEAPGGKELSPFQKLLGRAVADLRAAGAVNDLSIYFRDLDNGPWFGVNERDPYTPSSLLKVPLIIAALKQAESEASFLTRQIPYDGSIRMPPGSFNPEIRLEAGKSYPVEELIRRTASYSDNVSMALLKGIVDPQVLQRIYADLGLPRDLDLDPERRASISAYDYGRFFRVLYNASYLNREMSEKALGYFVGSSFSEGLVAGVPQGTTVAHKFGVLWNPDERPLEIQLHDCGIVYQPQRPYFLCVMTRGKNYQELKKAIGSVSRTVYDEVARQVGGSGAPATVPSR